MERYILQFIMFIVNKECLLLLLLLNCFIAGSPFTVEIIDASSVVATGNGLGMVEVNQRASFVIKTGDSDRSGGELKVNITCKLLSWGPSQTELSVF